MTAKTADRNLHLLALFGLLSCIISRAPLLLDKSSILFLSLNINVGYIVVFAPLVLAVGIIIIENRNKKAQRTLIMSHKISYLSVCFFIFFLISQFILNFSLKGDCGNISPHRFLWDFSLYEIQPEYCYSGIEEKIQNQMPYIYAPLQVWIYLVLALFCTVRCTLSIRESLFYSNAPLREDKNKINN